MVLPPEIVSSVPFKVICCASTLAYSDKSIEFPLDILSKLLEKDNTCDSASRFVVSVNALISVGDPVKSAYAPLNDSDIVGLFVRSL